jgi:hypothetical protein
VEGGGGRPCLLLRGRGRFENFLQKISVAIRTAMRLHITEQITLVKRPSLRTQNRFANLAMPRLVSQTISLKTLFWAFCHIFTAGNSISLKIRTKPQKVLKGFTTSHCAQLSTATTQQKPHHHSLKNTGHPSQSPGGHKQHAHQGFEKQGRHYDDRKDWLRV